MALIINLFLLPVSLRTTQFFASSSSRLSPKLCWNAELLIISTHGMATAYCFYYQQHHHHHHHHTHNKPELKGSRLPNLLSLRPIIETIIMALFGMAWLLKMRADIRTSGNRVCFPKKISTRQHCSSIISCKKLVSIK